MRISPLINATSQQTSSDKGRLHPNSTSSRAIAVAHHISIASERVTTSMLRPENRSFSPHKATTTSRSARSVLRAGRGHGVQFVVSPSDLRTRRTMPTRLVSRPSGATVTAVAQDHARHGNTKSMVPSPKRCAFELAPL